ncbi:MAG: NUDIX domain-containing protein [Desulfosarcina sp.]|nr:NUDIX domain-containing protein [Desulfobacterales bacterium]
MPEKTNCHFCGSLLTKKFYDGRDRLFCEKCNEPIYENPLPATCIVLVDDNERLLLVKRSVEPKIGHWCLPGGFIEIGESPEKGALRELQEETGLSGRIETLLGVTATTSSHYSSILMVGYLVKKYAGTPVAGDDAMDAAFFEHDKLPEIAFDSHRSFARIYYAAYR